MLSPARPARQLGRSQRKPQHWAAKPAGVQLPRARVFYCASFARKGGLPSKREVRSPGPVVAEMCVECVASGSSALGLGIDDKCAGYLAFVPSHLGPELAGLMCTLPLHGPRANMGFARWVQCVECSGSMSLELRW